MDTTDPTHLTLAVPDLPPGTYTVVWRTLSRTDGHGWIGSFPLTLLNPDGTRPERIGTSTTTAGDHVRGELPTPLETISRWLSLLGAILLCGVLFMRMQIDGGSPSTATATDLLAVASRSAIVLICAGSGAVILGGWLQWAGQAFALRDGGAALDLLFRTRGGNLNLCTE